MRGLAKQSRHIMFTEAQVVSFGNYLLQRYNVQVHSTDGKNIPIYQREVCDADICNWKFDSEIPDKIMLPSAFQPEDNALFCFDGAKIQAKVLGVHFYNGKVKYDLELYESPKEGNDSHYSTRIYNVDSAFVTKQP